MVRIRLRRVGFRNQPSFRIVATDKESPRDGRFLEILGSYNPRTNPSTLEIKEDKVFHWLSVGASPSASVTQLFKQVGLLDRFERFSKGEPIEKLLEEAKVVYEKRASLKVVKIATESPEKIIKKPKEKQIEKTETK
jgi:small subunit ribosomal protein S16